MASQADIGLLDRALLDRTAALLLANGQTTERVIDAVRRLGGALGLEVEVLPGWSDTTLLIGAPTGGVTPTAHRVVATPAGIDMRRVSRTMTLVDEVVHGRRDTVAAVCELGDISRMAPIALARFAVFAGLGAAALAMVFGATDPATLLAIACTACLGAVIRRALARRTGNLLVQPLVASLLAGVVGAVAMRHLPLATANLATASLVALCPCMVLLPGPHLLNAALDLGHGRIPLALARGTFGMAIVLVICTGLLCGLAIGGGALPRATPALAVPLLRDVVPAGVAVLAYGTFFSMPWRMLPIPVAVGMAAHAFRWGLIERAHASPALGAACACLVVGVVITPAARRLHLPFAGLAFASVVSLIPGVFLFRMAALLVTLAASPDAAPGLLVQAASDGITALAILVGMAAGLIVPKLVIDGVWRKGSA